MKKLYLILLVFLISISASFANVFEHPQKLSTIINQLPQLNSTTRKFKQEKTIPNSEVILKSGGNFKFIKNKGVIFETTYPITSTSTYTTRNYKQINEIINAISTKSYGKIEKVFNFYYYGTQKNWTLGLVPKKSDKSAKYLKFIEIEGDNNDISKIVIASKNSTKTSIWFFN